MSTLKCCICSKTIDISEGRNASPLKDNERCCPTCDNSIIMSIRSSDLTDTEISTISIPDIDEIILSSITKTKKMFSPNDVDAFANMCEYIECTASTMARTYVFGQMQRLKGMPQFGEREFADIFDADENALKLFYIPYLDGYYNYDFNNSLKKRFTKLINKLNVIKFFTLNKFFNRVHKVRAKNQSNNRF